MTTTENNNPQIDKYIKPIVKSYLTSVSNNEYGLTHLKQKHIKEFLTQCNMDDIKLISDLYQHLRKASWSKDVELMDFLIKCIERQVITNNENE